MININDLMIDSVTVSYFLIQFLVMFVAIIQAKKGFFKTALSIILIVSLYNYIYLNMFYTRK